MSTHFVGEGNIGSAPEYREFPNGNDEPRRLLERVRQRIHEGGHSVPADKILARYPRTLENLRQAVREVQLAMLFDATDTDAGGPHLVASVVAGQLQPHGPWLPGWARKVLSPLGDAA